MQQQGIGPRFEHKLIQLQRERQNGHLAVEAYDEQLTRLIEEEVASQEQVQQATQRAQLWEQAQQRWRNLEQERAEREQREKKEKVLQVEEKQKEKQQEMKRLQPTEEKRPVSPQTLEEKLFEERRKFYEEEAPAIIERYKDNARKQRSTHDFLQMSIIVCSALATTTTGTTIFTGATTLSIALKVIAALFSLVVAIASGAMAYFKYKERSNDTQKAADTIEDDYNALKLGTGIYKGKPMGESLSIFAENTNNTISDHKKKQQLLDQPPEAKSGQVVQ
jgi:hypothetical protein